MPSESPPLESSPSAPPAAAQATAPPQRDDAEPPVPECLMRDNLTSPYVPNTSLGMLLAVASVSLVFLLASFQTLDASVLWSHLSFGRWIVQHGALPAADPLVAQPAPQLADHAGWAGQTLFYVVYSALGLEGLCLLHALLLAATAALLTWAVCLRGVALKHAWPTGLAFVLLSLPQLSLLRPLLLGQLAAAGVLVGCALLPARKHPLLWLPVLFVLWANLHGAVLIGLALLGLCGLGAALAILAPKPLLGEGEDQPQTRAAPDYAAAWAAAQPFALAVVLCGAAACLNPAGPLLLTRLLAQGQHEGVRALAEWQTLRPGSLTGVLWIVSTLAAVYLYRQRLPHMAWADWLLLATSGLLTLGAIHMLAWWAVVWPFAVLPHFAAWRQAQHKPAPGDVPLELSEEPTAMRTLMALSFVFMTLNLAPPTYALLLGQPRGESQLVASSAPLYVADELDRRQLAGPLAAPLEWSDFLVWKSDGQVQPLVDLHLHLQTRDAWQDYKTIYSGEPAWLEKLRARKFKYVVISRHWNTKLVEQLLAADREPRSGLRLLYQDQQALLAEISPAPPPAPAADKPQTANGG